MLKMLRQIFQLFDKTGCFTTLSRIFSFKLSITETTITNIILEVITQISSSQNDAAFAMIPHFSKRNNQKENKNLLSPLYFTHFQANMTGPGHSHSKFILGCTKFALNLLKLLCFLQKHTQFTLKFKSLIEIRVTIPF